MTPSSRHNSNERKSDDKSSSPSSIDAYRSPSIDIGTPTHITATIEDGVMVARNKLNTTNSLIDVLRSDSVDSSSAPHMEMEERTSPTSMDGVISATEIQAHVRQAITALAICHNVTPVVDEGVRTYQAASPDEMALVKFADDVVSSHYSFHSSPSLSFTYHTVLYDRVCD
jgi:magnesium-transporting ATPase (P-type)